MNYTLMYIPLVKTFLLPFETGASVEAVILSLLVMTLGVILIGWGLGKAFNRKWGLTSNWLALSVITFLSICMGFGALSYYGSNGNSPSSSLVEPLLNPSYAGPVKLINSVVSDKSGAVRNEILRKIKPNRNIDIDSLARQLTPTEPTNTQALRKQVADEIILAANGSVKEELKLDPANIALSDFTPHIQSDKIVQKYSELNPDADPNVNLSVSDDNEVDPFVSFVLKEFGSQYQKQAKPVIDNHRSAHGTSFLIMILALIILLGAVGIFSMKDINTK